MDIPKESKVHIYTEEMVKLCRYSRDGICILSDCKCLKTADNTVECSSFKEK